MYYEDVYKRQMRASIYNAMPMEGVEKLVAFMDEFEKKWGQGK